MAISSSSSPGDSATSAAGGQPGLLGALRPYLRALRHLPDRLRHPARRRAAVDRLRRLDRVEQVLFLCVGNICRSPYAAARFAALAPGRRIGSGGFLGPDRPTPDEGQAEAAARGLDLSAHRSRLVTAEQVDAATLIVVMEGPQVGQAVRVTGIAAHRVVVLGDLDPEPIDTRTIRDPWHQPREVFASSYARIDRCVAELARALNGRA